MITNNGTGALVFTNPTFNTADTATATRTLTLGGSYAGNNEIQGVIRNNNTGLLGVTKSDSGTWILSGNNTYTGATTVSAGTLSLTGNNTHTGQTIIQNGALIINTLGNFTESSSLGKGTAGTSIQIGNTGTSGTLVYTGSGNTSNRTFQIGSGAVLGNNGGGTITNNGSGALVFSNATFNTSDTTATATRTLTLGGSNTGNNEIQGIIRNNNATVALAKVNVGTWILSGANTYTGTTTINAGTLLITGNSSSATGAVNVAAGATLGGNGTIGGAVTVAGSLSPGTASTLTLGSTLTFGSGSTLALTLGSNSSKIAFLSAVANLLGSGNATLSLTQDTGFDYGATYRIFENTSTTAFAFSSITGYDTSAYEAQFGFDSNNYNLTFTAVPEPSSYALLLFGLAGVIFARRRLRSKMGRRFHHTPTRRFRINTFVIKL
jgi:fibronectin-binding autotransporter adhesin